MLKVTHVHIYIYTCKQLMCWCHIHTWKQYCIHVIYMPANNLCVHVLYVPANSSCVHIIYVPANSLYIHVIHACKLFVCPCHIHTYKQSVCLCHIHACKKTVDVSISYTCLQTVHVSISRLQTVRASTSYTCLQIVHVSMSYTACKQLMCHVLYMPENGSFVSIWIASQAELTLMTVISNITSLTASPLLSANSFCILETTGPWCLLSVQLALSFLRRLNEWQHSLVRNTCQKLYIRGWWRAAQW